MIRQSDFTDQTTLANDSVGFTISSCKPIARTFAVNDGRLFGFASSVVHAHEILLHVQFELPSQCERIDSKQWLQPAQACIHAIDLRVYGHRGMLKTSVAVWYLSRSGAIGIVWPVDRGQEFSDPPETDVHSDIPAPVRHQRSAGHHAADFGSIDRTV